MLGRHHPGLVFAKSYGTAPSFYVRPPSGSDQFILLVFDLLDLASVLALHLSPVMRTGFEIKVSESGQARAHKHRPTEHGGSLILGKRRKRRPLNLKKPVHIVLKSDFAFGLRALTRHRAHIERVFARSARRFNIRIYQKAIEHNHIHALVRAHHRKDLQNFFRVLAGHIAQEIMKKYPILRSEISSRGDSPDGWGHPPQLLNLSKTRERENKFWQYRVYSRIVSWGRDFLAVKHYVIQNILESLGLVPYKKRIKYQHH